MKTPPPRRESYMYVFNGERGAARYYERGQQLRDERKQTCPHKYISLHRAQDNDGMRGGNADGARAGWHDVLCANTGSTKHRRVPSEPQLHAMTRPATSAASQIRLLQGEAPVPCAARYPDSACRSTTAACWEMAHADPHTRRTRVGDS